ncbi:hypothetical protein [Neisseria blantyrii]|uniref:hypothetical protein n=1 Tax=Neisseria blantyrii TaxID=2830647 RepID=UPI00265B4CD9|nr:hypothetical protein [Neisseria blantyrii]
MPSERREGANLTRLQINETPFYYNDYYYQNRRNKAGQASAREAARKIRLFFKITLDPQQSIT